MSLTRNNKALLPFIQAATGALEGAASLATGASVLQRENYGVSTTSQNAAAGAIGGALLGFTHGVYSMFRAPVVVDNTLPLASRIDTPFRTIGFNVLAGLVGGAIMHAAESSDLTWQLAVCTAVVGAGILYVPKMVAKEFFHQQVEPSMAREEGLLGDKAAPAYYSMCAS